MCGGLFQNCRCTLPQQQVVCYLTREDSTAIKKESTVSVQNVYYWSGFVVDGQKGVNERGGGTISV